MRDETAPSYGTLRLLREATVSGWSGPSSRSHSARFARPAQSPRGVGLLGHGGVRAVAHVAGMSETTVRRGVFELEEGQDPFPDGRARRAGRRRRGIHRKGARQVRLTCYEKQGADSEYRLASLTHGFRWELDDATSTSGRSTK
jgi:hypothetical protein